MSPPTPVVLRIEKDPRDPNAHLPHEERAGNCLELAAEYVMENGGVLMHGSIFHPQFSVQRIGHAFVLTQDGGIFEPTLGLYFPLWQAFFQWANAKCDAYYTQEQAALLMLRTGHYGTWDESIQWSGVWGSDVQVILPDVEGATITMPEAPKT